MLLTSHRHSQLDLELWDALEAADKANASSVSERGRKIDVLFSKAATAIIEFVYNQPPCYCGVSWGKDSVAVAHLLWSTYRHVPLIHLRPTNHNPDCDAVRDAYFSQFKGQPYQEIAFDYQIPDERESEQKWREVIREAGSPYAGRRILGIRKDESRGRRIRVFRWGENSPNASAPIGFWTTQDVFAYLAHHNLPIHPVYACMGGGRWPRDALRVDVVGDDVFGEISRGYARGRAEWEQEYYGDVLRRLQGDVLNQRWSIKSKA